MKDNVINEKEVKDLIKNKKVFYGAKQMRKSLKEGRAELVIVASNRKDLLNELKDVTPKIFAGNSKELGQTCGKPFNISVITVLKERE